MLYLEDYLEMIENLPMEMTDRFTEMREMDLQVQNAMDSLDDKVKGFFSKCKATQSLKQEWKDEQFQKLKKEYQKVLEDADEKVQLANQIYELVERYFRKLDQELAKFKMELEADNSGITEVLERRSLELDAQLHAANNHRGEKRKYGGISSNHVDKRPTTEKVLSSLASEAARETLGGMSRSASTPALGSVASAASPAISYSLGHVGAGSNAALAAAASRAIGATLEMPHGRRTASLKASYDALTGKSSKDLLLSGGTTTPADTPPPPSIKSSRTKKASARASHQAAQQAAQAAQQAAQQQAATAVQPKAETPTAGLNDFADLGVDVDATQATTTWAYDPNEPRYCICNDVSYGDMVGCDNDDCTIEWFHYNCVGLAQAPKGKWYCPQCTAAMKRRGRK